MECPCSAHARELKGDLAGGATTHLLSVDLAAEALRQPVEASPAFPFGILGQAGRR
jgi:hypothetical protein